MSYYRIKKVKEYLESLECVVHDIQMPDYSVGIMDGWVVYEFDNVCRYTDWITAEQNAEDDIHIYAMLCDSLIYEG